MERCEFKNAVQKTAMLIECGIGVAGDERNFLLRWADDNTFVCGADVPQHAISRQVGIGAAKEAAHTIAETMAAEMTVLDHGNMWVVDETPIWIDDDGDEHSVPWDEDDVPYVESVRYRIRQKDNPKIGDVYVVQVSMFGEWIEKPHEYPSLEIARKRMKEDGGRENTFRIVHRTETVVEYGRSERRYGDTESEGGGDEEAEG